MLALPTHRSSVVLAVGLALTVAVAAITALTRYSGNDLVLLSFLIANGLMLALSVPRPRLYGYTFLVVFLFLGFVTKLFALWIFGVALVEPTGAFEGSAAEWDAALLPSITAAIALIAVRLMHLRFADLSPDWPRAIVSPPNWYRRSRRWVIGVTVLLVVAFNLLNLFAGFYQVGLKPRVILPAHLNAAVSWLLTYGLAMWVAMLVGWELAVSAWRPTAVFLLPFVEALSTVSLLSRASFLFRALAYILATANQADRLRDLFPRRSVVAFIVLIPAGFVLSLATVSGFRIVAYPSRVLPPEPVPIVEVSGSAPVAVAGSAPAVDPSGARLSRTLSPVLGEISGMLIGRWIGIEGTMAVTSYPGRNPALFAASLIENPSAGENSLYQHVAGSPYRTASEFVFLTTPGVVAILYYSGSLLFVFLGMLFLGGFLVVIEVASARLVRSAFVISIAMLALANGIAQMNFPYLFVVLCAQVSVTLGAIAVVATPWNLARIGRARLAAEAQVDLKHHARR